MIQCRYNRSNGKYMPCVLGLKRAHTSWPASVLKLEALEVNQAGRFYQFFKNVEHSMMCEREKGTAYMFHTTPRFLKPARAALERVCIPTLIVLQEEVGSDGRCLTLWHDVWELPRKQPDSPSTQFRWADPEGINRHSMRVRILL